jgi:hypothetical protein
MPNKVQYQRDPIANRARCTAWKHNHPGAYKISNTLRGAKKRAVKAGVPFTITRETLPPIPEYCPVLGIKLEINQKGFQDNSASLDRIKPELGYVPGNVIWISYRANSIKRDATPDEIMCVATYFTNLETVMEGLANA